ncbi:TonB-dependent receptor [Microbulbifer thermotolerans]|uniref:TonB-dependent receptor n=1 Tax=Microbulbifer thermotolerans TaxID=252514 RepID=A0A143HQN4_MICTH|nr:TonB-dependent receptor [Microbulbifer thermotolerans]AMX03998.1 TonB-dependent receptor [Microbulbifer thermotolerans]
MTTFQLKPLALAMTVIAVPVVAQAQSAELLEEIEVTASYRDSLSKALNQKRYAVGSKDTILAEDIADFPDLNLAESLQRIPGVAITRDAGEGRNISVRGLGPQFTRVRINGLEAISTTGGTDSSGGANRSRSFDFNTFASELFSNLTVHKTSSADLDEGSLGATVDLNTGKPLDYDDTFTFAANGQMGYNDQSEEVDPRASFLIAGKNEAETFGWMASYSYSDRNILEQGFSTVRWSNSENFVNCSACADEAELAALNEGFFPRIPRYGNLTHEQQRQGFTGTLQFRPTDSTEILVDYLTSNFEATRQEEFVSVGIKEKFNYEVVDVVDYTMDSNGTITSMTLDDYAVRIENRFDELETKFDQFSIRASHDFSESLRVDGIVGASESNFSNPVQTTAIIDAYGIDGSFTYTDNGNLDFHGFDTTNPDNFQLFQLRHRPNSVDNTFQTIAFNVEYDINDTWRAKAGVSSKSYEFEVQEYRAEPKFAGISAANFGGNIVSMEGVSWFSPDVGDVYAFAAADVDAIMGDRPYETRPQDNRSVTEDDTGFYLQLSWDSELAGLPFRGNFGVRHVTTEVESSGWTKRKTADGDEIIPVSAENEYDDVLPSLNLALDVREDMVVRFSVADVMARPSLGDLSPYGSIDTYNGEVSFGNPKLDPFRARAYDLSYEWYFTDDAVLALAYFYKDVNSFITSASEDGRPWSETGLDASALEGAGGTFDENSLWNINKKVNGEGGELEGFEIQYQQPVLDNFGVILNYTYVDSEMNYGTKEDPLYDALTGMSKNTYNATAYYENDVFSARVSFSKRSDYMTRSPASTRNGLTYEGTLGTTNVDFVATYNLNDNTTLSFEGINLTDEPNVQVVDFDRIVVDHTTGRQFYLGAKYKF